MSAVKGRAEIVEVWQSALMTPTGNQLLSGAATPARRDSPVGTLFDRPRCRSYADLVLPATITLRPSAAKRLHNWAPSPRSGPTPTTIAVFMALASHAPKIAFSRHLAIDGIKHAIGDFA
jgi:hypothetical protein